MTPSTSTFSWALVSATSGSLSTEMCRRLLGYAATSLGPAQLNNHIKRVKLFIGCTLCGYKKHSDALHFDHLDITTKHAEISKMKSHSIGSVKKEMRKCRVLCANCHAEHTATQREEGVFNNEINT